MVFLTLIKFEAAVTGFITDEENFGGKCEYLRQLGRDEVANKVSNHIVMVPDSGDP